MKMSAKWLARGAALVAATMAGMALAAPSQPVSGEVRRIDAANNKVTLKHGPIPELELPAMTLVYLVKDPALLANLQPGDKVRFSADKVDGQYTVVQVSR
ncbi:copper-binding protein [Achromobacter sp. GG226]|uniref:copper-binding protein n=1 Tax=Verticiella alkaliphila TaxID=2779529 RepID=UPI001C0E2B27|nr:copper-binding protein [Verticiella sp. GG226]MBU4612897.1 copper-binding protein [Verticiella sp. GG226]